MRGGQEVEVEVDVEVAGWGRGSGERTLEHASSSGISRNAKMWRSSSSQMSRSASESLVVAMLGLGEGL